MVVYWSILIWIFIFEKLQSKYCRQVLVDGVYEYRPTKPYAIITISLLVFFAAMRCAPIDTGSYIQGFNHIPSTMDSFNRYVSSQEDSQLFYGFEMIFKCYISDSATLWLTSLAMIQGICIIKGLRQFSSDLGMSLYIFMASGMSISWMFNGIRQFTAVCILFACSKMLLNKKYVVPYLLLVLLMIGVEPICKIFHSEVPIWFLGGIHQSALLMIPVVILTFGKAWSWHFWIMLPVGLALMFAMGGFDKVVSNTSYSVDMQYVENDAGASPVRAIVALVPVILIMLKRSEIINTKLSKIINLSCNMSVVTFVLYTISSFTSGIFIGRLPIYSEMYNLILIPWLIKHPYKYSSKSLSFMLHSLYLLYFIYQMYIAYNRLSYASDILGIYQWGGTL